MNRHVVKCLLNIYVYPYRQAVVRKLLFFAQGCSESKDSHYARVKRISNLLVLSLKQIIYTNSSRLIVHGDRVWKECKSQRLRKRAGKCCLLGTEWWL